MVGLDVPEDAGFNIAEVLQSNSPEISRRDSAGLVGYRTAKTLAIRHAARRRCRPICWRTGHTPKPWRGCVMTAEIIARALGGRKAGSGWVARCPAHDDRTPSLAIRDADNGKVLVHCHTGCDPRNVIAALKARGLLDLTGRRQRRHVQWRNVAEPQHDKRQDERSAVALALWRSSKPTFGTAVESYLASRGIDPPLPSSLRFHPGLKHPSGGIWPAMVALVTNGADGTPLAIHRTFLARDEVGKARVDPQKMMLGPCRGGVVSLADPGDLLMIGEGIETCLSAMQATGHPAWAALSTSGLRGLDLPVDVSDVVVLADGDDAGEAAAQDCARKLKREGRRVRIARPPKGCDFNDLLIGSTARSDETVS
jgi:putative DNA primase/helicase